MAATVVGVTAQSGGTGGTGAVRNQLALTGVSHVEILVAVAILLLLAGALIIGLARRHGQQFEPSP